jgi:hypothetical protein
MILKNGKNYTVKMKIIILIIQIGHKNSSNLLENLKLVLQVLPESREVLLKQNIVNLEE